MNFQKIKDIRSLAIKELYLKSLQMKRKNLSLKLDLKIYQKLNLIVKRIMKSNKYLHLMNYLQKLGMKTLTLSNLADSLLEKLMLGREEF